LTEGRLDLALRLVQGAAGHARAPAGRRVDCLRRRVLDRVRYPSWTSRRQAHGHL